MKRTDGRVVVKQFIQARREKVYEVFTRPELVRRWLCPDGLEPGKVEADFRVGGSYRSEMIGGGEVHVATGAYREIVPGEKVVFTHGWEGPGFRETQVTVLFHDRDGGTEIELTHERFANEAERQGHAEGWQSSLRKFERTVREAVAA